MGKRSVKKTQAAAGEGGFPKHGEEYTEEQDDPNRPKPGDQPDDDEGEDIDEEDAADQDGDDSKSLAELREELRDLRAEMRARSGLQEEPKKTAARKDPTDEVDWDTEFYNSPKSAMSKFKKMIQDEIRSELTNAYQSERSEEVFWTQFYKNNDDLEEHRDLVEATLRRNQADLGQMTVEKASKKLADLTRERIMRIKGESSPRPGGRKVTVEGSGPSRPKPKVPDEEKVVTLSDIIRQRRAGRNKGSGKGVAA